MTLLTSVIRSQKFKNNIFSDTDSVMLDAKMWKMYWMHYFATEISKKKFIFGGHFPEHPSWGGATTPRLDPTLSALRRFAPCSGLRPLSRPSICPGMEKSKVGNPSDIPATLVTPLVFWTDKQDKFNQLICFKWSRKQYSALQCKKQWQWACTKTAAITILNNSNSIE